MGAVELAFDGTLVVFNAGPGLELLTPPAVVELGTNEGVDVEGVNTRLFVSMVGGGPESVDGVVVPLPNPPPSIGVDAPPLAPPEEPGRVVMLGVGVDGVVVPLPNPPPSTGVDAPPEAAPDEPGSVETSGGGVERTLEVIEGDGVGGGVVELPLPPPII